MEDKPVIQQKFKPLIDKNIEDVLTVKFIHHRQLTSEELNVLTEFTQKNDLKIVNTNDDHTDIYGTTTNFMKALNMNLQAYSLNEGKKKKSYYSNTDDIVIPENLPFITNIMGFNNMPVFKPHIDKVLIKPMPKVFQPATQFQKRAFIKPRKNAPLKPNANARLLTSFTPLQLASLYRFPAYTGSGQAIGIIELGGGYLANDLNTYFTNLGLSVKPTVVSVSVDGAVNNPSDTSGANYEVVLDIQVAGAIANASTIVVYFAPNSTSGFYNAIYRAINDTTYNPSTISISWGAPEVYWRNSDMNAYNALFATAIAKNINIFAAAGDNGSTDGVNNRRQNADFPASSPNVVACGGTTLNATSSVISSEVVWNNRNGNATGGGFSSLFSKPSYQNGISLITTKRGEPDISANADPRTGYQIYMGGVTYVIGGTSAVSPLMAGLIARVNQAKGSNVPFINPNVYSKSICFDIVSGNNGAYTARTGWDACTGKGRLDGSLVIANL